MMGTHYYLQMLKEHVKGYLIHVLELKIEKVQKINIYQAHTISQ
jgi:hypothetical protein